MTYFLLFMLSGSKEKLLEQCIPATYLALEDVVGILAMEQKMNQRDPVLPIEQYRVAVAHIMNSRFRMSFRDIAELNQVLEFISFSDYYQGPDLYAFIGFIGFIGDINYMC